MDQPLSTECFNAILGGCDWEMALEVLEEMAYRRVARDHVSFATAASACERRGAFRQAFRLLDEGRGQEPRLRRAPFAPRSFVRGVGWKGLELRRMLRSCRREAPRSFRVNPVKAGCFVVSRGLESLGTGKETSFEHDQNL